MTAAKQPAPAESRIKTLEAVNEDLNAQLRASFSRETELRARIAMLEARLKDSGDVRVRTA